MRKTKNITLILFCLLLAVGCSGGEEVVEEPQEEPVVEEIGQLVLPLGIDHELDLDLDGEQETLTVQHNEVRGASANVSHFVEAQLQESVSELSGLELTILIKDYRVIPDETQPVLVLYVGGKQENEVFFYALDEDMLFTYLGKIAGEEEFFELGEIELHGNHVDFGGKHFEMDSSLPSVPLMYQDKNEALDYLDLPVYSIRSGFGNPDVEEQVGTEEKLTYLERDLVVFLEGDKINRICTSSGSLLDIEVDDLFLEEEWQQNERYELLELATSAEDYKVARFDLDKYFVECTLWVTETGMEVTSLCVSLSELYQARLYEEHVLVDRFGNLIFAENEDSWRELLGTETGWSELLVLGYERENAVIFFQGQKDGSLGVYHYNLLSDQVTLLVGSPESAEFSGGLLSVSVMGGRRYFDLGGLDVTEEIMGPSLEETEVEFYVQSDTLFYLPAVVEDYLVLKDLNQSLRRGYEDYKTSFDTELDLGYLEAYAQTGDQVHDLYLFLPGAAQLKFVREDVSSRMLQSVGGELRLVLTLPADDGPAYECYDLSGAFLGLCDQSGNVLK